MQYDLSIIIPARSEMFLSGTVEKILERKRGKTEVIVVLDGEWSNPPIKQHPDVNVIYVNEAIGQRAATNIGARLSKAKYVMKLDAHCLFDEGFDSKMIKMFDDLGNDITAVPVMRNLWMFDWKCYKCGKRIYQDKEPKCPDCGNDMRRKMLWIGKHNPQSTSYCFDSEPHFQYFEDWKHREPYQSDKKNTGYTESMSIQGSCFMLTRDKYWELNISDESFGNWGSQGIEVACKTWLSGGRVMINHHTWYAHLFRTKSVFGFPWPVSGRAQRNTRESVKDVFFNGPCKWDKAIRPTSWLVEKFWPVKGWTQKDLDDLKRRENP